MDSVYNSWNSYFKTPFGAVEQDQAVQMRLRLPHKSMLSSPKLLLYRDGEYPNPSQTVEFDLERADRGENFYLCFFSVPEPGLYFYNFTINDGGKTVFINKGYDSKGYLGPESKEQWQLTVYQKGFEVPDYLSRGVMYQIFPDRFCRSGTPKQVSFSDRQMHENTDELPRYNWDGECKNDDYFGGDLAGITQKLPFLHELGVTVLYLNPIFEAHSNHRYNTADYMKIDPLLGTEEDFSLLCEKAANLGIRIILDGVFNHTGSDSIYFNKEKRYDGEGAYNSEESPYASWYQFEHFPDQYRCWWGISSLPAVDATNLEYQNFICGKNGVVEKWLKLGASGWRIDVADELPDGFLDRLRRTVKEQDGQNALIGEVWEDASNKFSYGKRRRYLLGKQFDSVMNYPLRCAILDFVRDGKGYELFDCLVSLSENYPPQVLMVLMNFLSTHDTIRAITFLGGEHGKEREWLAQHNQLEGEEYEQGKRLLKLALVLLFTLPGIPCLYYGEEAGLGGYSDPLNRCFYPWGKIDQELVGFISSLARFKHGEAALAQGWFCPVQFNGRVAIYERRLETERILVAVNRSEEEVDFELLKPYHKARLLAGSCDIRRQKLAPYSYVILKALRA